MRTCELYGILELDVFEIPLCEGLEFGVWGFGFRVQDSGLRVEG